MTSVPPVQRPQQIEFTGERGDFRRLVSRGALLELITAGFYRFWLATDMRRHLWSNTVVDGDAAEYTGRARELLIGFLIAMAILMPVYVAYFLVGLAAEEMQAFASFPLLLFFYLFGQFAIYRARRYRLTRTVWRGVRFWMTGSGWAYAMRASLWGVLMGLTLGLILPWREAALERYKMKHSHYGDLQGSFAGTGGAFFKRGWWIWLLGVALIIASSLAPALVSTLGTEQPPLIKLLAGLPALLTVIATPFLYALFKAVEWRWWLSGLRFGDVSVASDLKATALFGMYWKVIGWSLLLIVGLVLYLGACTEVLALTSGGSHEDFFKPEQLANNIPLIALGFVGYLGTIVCVNIVIRVYLLRDLWKLMAQSVTLSGLDAAANVAARGDLATAVGEGFADGLDVAGF